MARLSERYTLQHIDDGKGLVFGSDITGEEIRLTASNEDGSLSELLKSLVVIDGQPLTPFGEHLPLTADEATALVFFLGYFYGNGVFG